MTLPTQIKDFKKIIPRRTASSQKGDFGRLLILSGSRRMVGCAVLAAQAALRCGIGLLTLGFPKGLYPVYTRRLTEAMFLPLAETRGGSLSDKASPGVLKFLKTQDVLALGPGLSRDPSTQKLIREIVRRADVPLVIDADGLFPFSGKPEMLRKVRGPLILTPHAGEFERLFGTDPGPYSIKRERAVRTAARVSGGIVVLKGHRTVIADPAGKIYVNSTGNPGLAKGGTGDVLLGMIASFLAQGIPAFQAACLSVFLHGLAADLAVKKITTPSLLATDLLGYLPLAFKKLGVN